MSVADIETKYLIEFESNRFILKRPDFQVEGWFVDWVRQRAFASCEVIPDPATRSGAIGVVAGEISAGMYDFEYDSGLGQVNYVDKALKTFLGVRQWLFLSFKRSTPFLISKDGEDCFLRLWKNTEKRNEALQKLRLFNAVNPQTPPEDPESPKEAE